MASPTEKLTTLRPDLGTLHEFDLDMQRRNYVGLQIMPRFDVARQSGKFGRIPIEQLLAAGDEKLERAALSGFSRQEWEFVEESFATTERGVEEPIDDREAELYADYFDAEVIAAARGMERLFSGYERRVLAQAIDATETASRTTAADTPWDNSNATPRGDVRAAAKKIWERTGLWPNTLVVDQLAFLNLQDCAEVIDRLASAGAGSSTAPGDITAMKLAQFFGVDRVLVANAIKLGTGGTVQSLFPSSKALLLRTAMTNDMREPCFGRTVVYSGIAGDFDPVPETYREENVVATIVRMRHESEEKVLYPEMAEVITGLETVE